ncbi:endonuclease III domain-containing protein [Chloroflexota bacterium]
MGFTQTHRQLKEVYDRLFSAYGQQHWWPAEEPFEMMIGAILTQSAAWRNAEKAIDNLKTAEALSPATIRSLSLSELARIIRPCGYFNTKALKLKALVDWFATYSDDFSNLSSIDTYAIRWELLGVHGIGPETADSILLYAIGRPVFVIDAYTRRIISRVGFVVEEESYDGYQRLFRANLAADRRLFNEYHALLVKLAKDVCRKQPLCSKCCLNDLCSFSREGMEKV